MQIVLYRNPKSLPSSVKPAAPLALFDSDRQMSWRTGVYDESFGSMIPRYKIMPLCETWIWPVLLGLKTIKMPLLAHVSFGVAEDKVHHNKKVNTKLELTTLPQGPYVDIISVLGSVRKNETVSLFGKEAFSSGLFNHPEIKVMSEKVLATDQFWYDFFYKKLIEARQELLDRSGQMVVEARKIRRASDAIRDIT